MMVLWEHRQISVKDMGALLYLDSGTLTPVLKKLEQKGYLVRARDSEDERVLNVTITELGEKLKEDAVLVPKKMGCCVCLEKEDADEFALIDEMERISGVKIPQAIEEIRDAKILQNRQCKPEEMEETVKHLTSVSAK